MTIPPSFIAVKRKLTDEPLDLLYIEQEGDDAKKQNTKQAYHFKRLRNENYSGSLKLPPSKLSSVKEKPLGSTSIKAEGKEKNIPKVSVEKAPKTAKPKEEPVKAAADKLAVPKEKREPRRFHLLRNSSLTSSPRLSPRHGIQKRAGSPRRRAMAVFSEQVQGKLIKIAKKKPPSGKKPVKKEAPSSKDSVKDKKRHTKKSSSVEEELELAASLQAFALEITGGDAMSVEPTGSAKSRDGEGEDIWVIDHYVRHIIDPAQQPSTDETGQTASPNGKDPSEVANIGYIVIREEDRESWEAYGQHDLEAEEDNEFGFDDDEDSNAEDWHGNDYPDEPDYDSDDVNTRRYSQYFSGGPVLDSDDDSSDYDSDDAYGASYKGRKRHHPAAIRRPKGYEDEGEYGPEDDYD